MIWNSSGLFKQWHVRADGGLARLDWDHLQAAKARQNCLGFGNTYIKRSERRKKIPWTSLVLDTSQNSNVIQRNIIREHIKYNFLLVTAYSNAI